MLKTSTKKSIATIIVLSIILTLLILLLVRLRGSTNQSLSGDAYVQSLAKKNNRFFPFRYFKDERGRVLPIVSLGAFFRSDADKARYMEYIQKGIKIIGITSYKSFPKKITDVSEDKYHITDNFDYTGNIKNWLCCFRNASDFGFTSQNKLSDQSESDFYDVDTANTEKKYDFIYICNKDSDACDINGWNAINRNYRLALSCFPIMISEMGLRGLIVGRVKCGLEEKYGNMIETTDFLPYHELQTKMRQSRFLFVPNVLDASPRVVSECLIKGVPVLMNRHILCGYKYINRDTGVFFTDESDIRDAIVQLKERIDNKQIDPRQWWSQNYGVTNASVRLRNFLAECYPDVMQNVKEVKFIL